MIATHTLNAIMRINQEFINEKEEQNTKNNAEFFYLWKRKQMHHNPGNQKRRRLQPQYHWLNLWSEKLVLSTVKLSNLSKMKSQCKCIYELFFKCCQ